MRNYLLILLVLISTIGFAQTSKEDAEVRVTLRDGSVFNGSVNIKTVVLDTKYGKLTLPFSNVGYIDVGITPDKTNEVKIKEQLKQLLLEDEVARQKAYEDLLKISISSIPVVSGFINSDTYTPPVFETYTPEKLLDELHAINNLTEGYSEEDMVSIDYLYIMGGTYTFKSIDLKTEFGQLNIPKEKIKKIEVVYVPGGSESQKTFVLPASKYISGNTAGGWYKTGIMVKKGQRLAFSATGEVALQSLSGAKYNPDGAVGVNTTGYDYDGYDNNASTYPTYGNLVFRIGENGTMMKAGSKFTGVANETGILFISIYETVYNASNSGSYNVKISVN